ncbi:MAG: SRPBCC family protein [Myxococcota bacterium]
MSTPTATPGVAPTIAAPLVVAPLVAEHRFELAERVDTVYAFVTHHESLPTWLLPVRSVRVDRSAADEHGVGAVRVVNPGTRAEARETVRWASPPDGFAYSADDASLHGLMTDHTSIFRFEPAGDARTLVTWAIHGHLPPGLRGTPGRLTMLAVLRLGARGLRRHFSPSS